MNIFKFKQFEVEQTGCAMKINTDGVLLAALVESDAPKRILDIGTGTGVLALMMAQRFPLAKIVAVEIDEVASITAERNFQSSIFSERLLLQNIAIEKYQSTQKFDLMISNPPFFVNDLKNSEEKKGIARHADQHFFSSLIEKVNQLLSEDGCFWFILPIKQAELLIKDAEDLGFNLTKVIKLCSDRSKPAFRWIVCLSRENSVLKTSYFYIYESEKLYTKDYYFLLKDFFLGY